MPSTSNSWLQKRLLVDVGEKQEYKVSITIVVVDLPQIFIQSSLFVPLSLLSLSQCHDCLVTSESENPGSNLKRVNWPSGRPCENRHGAKNSCRPYLDSLRHREVGATLKMQGQVSCLAKRRVASASGMRSGWRLKARKDIECVVVSVTVGIAIDE